ncbi:MULTISPECIES: metallophosphoesterase family protein [Prochlorococcus]|uniref:DNA repair exonuclease n=1 Tax=Prochlorococcus marinus (strain SARG / CCMP1375 / SS120) TaxID=167539 RepID=Q7VCN7_PROMA|nr:MULTISPECIES: DNA repair exonuclease [Prochlorococcus]AAP99747.1 DNA repair exonuclease [Prochlorococcus marinus subsp. marinus str. CCMP1375]KGG14456.1 DNA double-strand break repair protein Mre11 [Prochlorococcus marinus str. LG]KGG22554.1 DNA double-strand break repair protein Mre11 [Prochlorococcus marinus str. SS2]KGG24397.1 DNA double-strand break repair protein Mre11 [Prochlorococcus marinus str. SS35]KGG34169.1 DNA double-strand break repair protein Mre11 [Prochlorococcus marinus st
MARFIHTADWQIGKPYLQIKDEQKRFKLRQERLNVIGRIRDKTREVGSQFVLIAGDLFDSPTPSTSTVTEVLETIGEMQVPTFVIPGNHDHGALGTVWHSNDFIKHQKQLAPNLKILLNSQPVEIEEAVIFPCPLLRNKSNADPTLWLKTLDWNSVSSLKPRIILAHGGVHEFSGRDYILDEEAQPNANNIINLKEVPDKEIDYIALGDWHNLKQVSQKAWYSGTPEPDRFNQGENNQRGQILEVDVSRNGAAQVKAIPTGRLQWHNMNFKFHSDDDLNRFEREIEALTAGRVARDLLRVEISGELSLAGHRKYELLKTDLENKLLRLRIKGECHQTPKSDELEELTRSTEDPLIAKVASQLQEQLKKEKDQASEKAYVIRIALCQLYKFAGKN